MPSLFVYLGAAGFFRNRVQKDELLEDKIGYLMDSEEENVRLDIKTDPEAVRKQAGWCGLRPGMRVLDAGCGSGITTSILYDMVQPSGTVVGVDYSEDRIRYARDKYGRDLKVTFNTRDLRNNLNDLGNFDLIWVRFVLEYNRVESFNIIKNLAGLLNPGGYLCLLDLDHNCLNHYELSPQMMKLLHRLMEKLDDEYNFDAYAGRKLYSYLYDLGLKDIQMDLVPHHIFYGKIDDKDVFNWTKKMEMAAARFGDLFDDYPGGSRAFSEEFEQFLHDPRSFTYTPMILCKGKKPVRC
ncbi:MAG: class I SAM-dependent methyltransferase [Deltaproteobacteria bacterium]|nr:class I SAM-dependent methyltransferase [Deltaproteobacteria bacterium]